MLTRAENEALCRVGPGTLMGNLMREYWVPALLSSELPAADIYDRLADGSMPCDEPWPADRVALFRQWQEAGSPP